MRCVADFLLELLTEEIPARMQAKAAADLGRLFAEAMAARGVAGVAEVHVTPRRLALIARGLPAATQATREERRGPRADAPEGAILGFCKGAGVAREALDARDDPKGRFLYASIERSGRALADVLAEAVPEAVGKLGWPKSMRWGAASVAMDSPRWVRPLSGVVALLDGAVVPMTILGMAAGRVTRGHRFMHSGPIEIASVATYEAQLRAAHVILDAAERRRLIEEGARAAAGAAGLVLVEDAGLVAENAGLTEWPVPLLGRFDPAFLDVPREVIQLTMRTNQKYFACTDVGGALAPAFVCVANIAAADRGAGIVEGNRRVLAARLSDARFFWEQDRARGLDAMLPALERVVFHEKLGTMRDKAERVARLARWLVESGAVKPTPVIPGLTRDLPASVGTDRIGGTEEGGSRLGGRDDGVEALADMAERAGRLAKADLVSAMVGEFPELQGVMGGYYAAGAGEAAEVAAAVRDHYRPVGPGDFVPVEPVSVAVALADKLDTIVSFFTIGEAPSGSRDPYAIRRAAITLISVLFKNSVRFPVFAAIAFIIRGRTDRIHTDISAYLHELAETLHKRAAWLKLVALDPENRTGIKQLEPAINPDNLKRLGLDVLERAAPGGTKHLLERCIAVVDFLIERLKVQQREAGVRHDLIDAVFALGGEDDLVRLLARVHALQAYIATANGANLLAAYKRAANILAIEAKRDNVTRFDGAVFADGRQSAHDGPLALLLDQTRFNAIEAVRSEDFESAMGSLAQLRKPLDAFFEAVMINDPDRDVRSMRLALLQRFTDAVNAIADFSRIEG